MFVLKQFKLCFARWEPPPLAGEDTALDLQDIVFVLAALMCLISACVIVTRRNPVYAVIAMLPLFVGMATLFVLLKAPFLAAMQIMVYGGAILVVFLFVIMLINLRPEELKDDFAFGSYFLTAVGAGLMAGLMASFIKSGVPVGSKLEAAFAKAPPAAFGSIENISMPLFQEHIVPFELASVLIMVAVLGAVILSKRRV